jgi:hypothetical protein
MCKEGGEGREGSKGERFLSKIVKMLGRAWVWGEGG